MPTHRLVTRAPLAGLEPQFQAIRELYGVPAEYPEAAVSEALAAGATQGEQAHVADARADRTELNLVTIDPEGSRDLDQALAIETRDDGWLVYYAIADVAAHVVPGGALDGDTWSRVETVYCPDKRVGLHPPQMSEGFASLLPRQRTKAALWSVAIEGDGSIGAARVERAWVMSRTQYSYAELQHEPPAEARALVALMRALGGARRAHLAARGGVTLPKPSQEVVVRGGELSLEFRAAVGVEDDNAQVSLLTGEAAARIMLEAGVGILRTMPAAQPADVERLRLQALALGIAWPKGESYGDILATLVADDPKVAAFLMQATRLFRGAEWLPFGVEGLGVPAKPEHGALAAPYAHVTAPLRRLVDRYGTEVCLAHCAGREVPEWVRAGLPTLGQTMIAGVRRGAALDRECVDAVEAAVLAPHIGEEFDAVGLDERTVQLAEPAVVARCMGSVKVGERQRVRLVKADADGPGFVALS